MERSATIYRLKPAFQNLLRPAVHALARAGVTPNQVTLAGVALSAATGTTVFAFPGERRVLLLLPVALFVRMALNAVDGMLAREHGKASNLGAILNEMGDVVSDALLYLPLARVPGMDPMAVSAVVVLAVITEMAGVLPVGAGPRRRYDGPMGKSDRAFVFGALVLALGCGAPRGRWIDAALVTVLALQCITILNRSRAALREARR